MSVLPVTDAMIGELVDDSARLDDLDVRSPPDACYLADFWDGLHFLLVEGSQSSTLPAAALKFGDVSLRVGRESVHAILTRTLKRLADEINGLTEPALRERFDMERMLQANVYPVRPWMFPEEKESTFRELMVYFERFRKVVRKAAAEGDGLVFCRYEDL